MIKKNVHILHEKITEICNKSGRNPAEIKIVAVSKNTGIDLIEKALSEGLINLGESKAQELKEKALLIKKDVIWHFIGHLQTNKIKYIIDAADYIHSVDSIKLADEVNRQAFKKKKSPKVLIEVKTSGEESKYGIKNFDELLELAQYCNDAKNIELVGLMTMAPLTDNEKIIRKSFSDLRKFKVTLNEQGFSLSELSMGMTSDYEIAIEEGATMIRIGTAIFGERDYSKSWKDQ